MLTSKLLWKSVGLLIVAAALIGCTGSDVEEPSGIDREHAASAEDVDEAAQSDREAIRYNISKLPDRDYVEIYGDEENPRPWYTAAEALSEIGKPAVPALIERLDTADSYELMLALYALMLASQDPALLAETDGDYLRLDTVLTQDTNEENLGRALDWWQRYRHLWPSDSP